MRILGAERSQTSGVSGLHKLHQNIGGWDGDEIPFIVIIEGQYTISPKWYLIPNE